MGVERPHGRGRLNQGDHMTWLAANWQTLAITLLAIDTALIRLFPNAGVLKTIQTDLGEITPKS